MVNKIKSYLLIFAGVTMLSAGISLFCIPNRIVSGGVSGISTILYYMFDIPAGISYYIINIILLGMGYRYLSKSFVVRTLICSGLVSVFTDIFSKFPPVTDDVVLASLFGGVIYGIGIGCTLISDASTGGSDIIGRLIQNKFPHLPIGKALLFTDMVIIAVSLWFFKEINLSLYGVLSLFVSTTAIDMFIHRLNVSKIAFVISDDGEKVKEQLINSFKRGVTVFDAKGGYTEKDKKMLLCALKENEMNELKKTVLNADPNAFMVFGESREILGNGFYVYH